MTPLHGAKNEKHNHTIVLLDALPGRAAIRDERRSCWASGSPGRRGEGGR
ncbi:MAG: hypothetical protein IT438_16320 [Phycisphaerales bacterium]|nr:hypothetical protein [Phycisphaerales bacterium]